MEAHRVTNTRPTCFEIPSHAIALHWARKEHKMKPPTEPECFPNCPSLDTGDADDCTCPSNEELLDAHNEAKIERRNEER